MQTFLPMSTSFKASAQVLDNKRLNKQALEGWQILMTLLELDPTGSPRTPKGWVNHPAVKMWRGYEFALYQYVQQMVIEWKRRGFKSTIGDKASNTFVQAKNLNRISGVHQFPDWMVDVELYKKICSSHRTALLSKNYEWYSQFGWPEDTGVAPFDYEYVWPSKIKHAVA
jgi:hypothetical protein